MASGLSFEVLDLRHFAAPVLQPLLRAEGELWRKRLHWDYHISARLLTQYLDSHMLPGFVAIEGDRAVGYSFCVYEENKAIIGNVFALPGEGLNAALQARRVEETLLGEVISLLRNSPQVDRIESQLLLPPSGAFYESFTSAGFSIYRRLFMIKSLEWMWSAPQISISAGLELRTWRDEDLTAASRLIVAAYADHPDAYINDQYRTVHGSLRFLNNIVRFSGCGVFSSSVSHVIVDRVTGELAAMVLGSRVSSQAGHITQICVHPRFRRGGLARMLLSVAAFGFQRLGVEEISLTVTEENQHAIELYISEDFHNAHAFDATIWQRTRWA